VRQKPYGNMCTEQYEGKARVEGGPDVVCSRISEWESLSFRRYDMPGILFAPRMHGTLD
jgi:hypothetical protein